MTNLLRIIRSLIVLFPIIGIVITNYCERSHGIAIHITGKNLIFIALLLFGLIFLYHRYYFHLKKKYGFRLLGLMYASLLFGIGLLSALIRIYLIKYVGLDLPQLAPLIFSVGGGQALPFPDPYGTESSSPWEEDSFELRVLEESFSPSKTEEGEPSVNQEQEGARPALPTNPVASGGEEAGPSNRVVPYPYHPDEIIGGDCVHAIERRLLAKYDYPSYEVIQLARIQAEDLFEVKVEIIRVMAGLDPTGDWMGRGAWALENPRTATGEYALDRLCRMLTNLNERGVQSQEFVDLQNRVLRKGSVGGDESSIA